jgi:hypothetical protein
MSDPTSRIPLPELPKLDQRDLDAIRGTLPGKLLGRMAALLAVFLLTLGFAGSVDLGLRQFLAVDLQHTPQLRLIVLFGLPGSVVLLQLLLEWRATRSAARQRLLAVAPASVPAGYFRIGPYTGSAANRAAFRRADGAHHAVLAWLKATSGAPLYLTGQSGCGKSSLLQAFVLPGLREAGFTVAEARAWQDRCWPWRPRCGGCQVARGGCRAARGRAPPLPATCAA